MSSESKWDEAPFRAIARHYRDLIRSGELVPGSDMPSRRAMRQEHGVARATIDKAMNVLADERLILLQPPPRRAKVANVLDRHTYLEERMATPQATDQALRNGEISKIISVGMMTCPVEIAKQLGVSPGALVGHRQRVHMLHHHPVSMSTSYYTAEMAKLVPELAVHEPIPSGSRELILERMGVDYAEEADQVVIGRTLKGKESRELRLPPKAIVLEVTGVIRVETGQIIEVAQTISSANRPLAFKTKLRNHRTPPNRS